MQSCVQLSICPALKTLGPAETTSSAAPQLMISWVIFTSFSPNCSGGFLLMSTDS